MSTCYRPPDLEDKAFFRQQEDVLVLTVNRNHSSICWKGIRVGHKQYSGLPECVWNRSSRRSTVIHLLFSRKEEVAENVKFDGRLGYRNLEMMKFKILRGVRKMGSILTTLDFQGQASVCSEKW